METGKLPSPASVVTDDIHVEMAKRVPGHDVTTDLSRAVRDRSHHVVERRVILSEDTRTSSTDLHIRW